MSRTFHKADTLSWTAAQGTSYTIQYKTNLNQTLWNKLGTTVGAGASTTFTDTNSLASQRFYQVVSP